MRPGGVPILLFFLGTVMAQTSGGDVYWENEEDAANEFLETKEEDTGHFRHIRSLNFFDFWGTPSSTEAAPENFETATDDPVDDTIPDGKDDELDNDGSGLPDRPEPEPREKTLRVTFVVTEPYHHGYSNRDSVEFQNFSHAIAEAVNQLFESLPGTQRASLVRIQSRLSDEFSCKVTLDIVTTGYDDTDRITKNLRDHIRTRRKLGSVTVDDADFSANVIDPGSTLNACVADEIQCTDSAQCLPESARCNGFSDCSDGSDEAGCPPSEFPSENEILSPNATESALPTTTLAPTPTSCPSDEMRCDETRCVSLQKRCDGYADCFDGTDEANCLETCGDDDFRCDNGRCIEGFRRCNKIVDCSREEDEQNCPCQADEFKCISDGSCIELRKRCDGFNNCLDQSDEQDCDGPRCPADRFECNPESSVPCAMKCDGQPECSGGEDEENCPELCSMQCDGRCLDDHQICDDHQDCSDGSDEQYCNNCDGADDFRCKSSGECINSAQRCNGIPECNDRSDEADCNSTMISFPLGCLDNQFQCRDGSCIDSQFYCDGHTDCVDNSDELNCPCVDPENFQCSTGECIPSVYYCDGREDCSDGSDEVNCGRSPSGSSTEHAYTTEGRYPQRPGEGGLPKEAPTSVGSVSGREDGQPDSDPRGYPSGQSGTGSDPRGYPSIQSGADPRGYPGGQSGPGSNPRGYPSGQSGPGSDPRGYASGQSGPGSDPRGYPSGDPRGYPSGQSGGYPGGQSGAGSDPRGYPSGQSGGYPSGQSGPGSDPRGYPSGQSGEYPSGQSGPGSDPRGYSSGQSGGDPRRYPSVQSGGNSRGYSSGQSGGDPRGYSSGQSGGYPNGQGGISSATTSYPDRASEEGSYPYRTSSPVGSGNNGDSNGCPDPSDFQCSSGQCIPSVYYCDGRDDCADSSDEINCSYYPASSTEYPYHITEGNSRYGGESTDAPEGTTPGSFPGYADRDSGSSPSGYPYVQSGEGDSGRESNNRPGGAPGEGTYPYGNGSPFRGGSGNGYPNGAATESTGSRSYGGPVALNVKTYPDAQTVRYAIAGGDVVFQCRDEGPERAPVRWVREGGRPLKPGSSDRNGRLEMYAVSVQDGGVYICQTPRYLRYPGSEVKVTLTVEPATVTSRPPFAACKPYEATCGNGQCIPKTAICNGVIDCNDKSDEETCHANGMCEPNEYQCANRKCILKTWLCDAENDCGDMSDEQNCGPIPPPGQGCQPVEFACASGDQCVLKSFHCDGQTDCFDRSDEIGCAPVHVTMSPKPANLKLNPGDMMTLTCKAVGVPTPLISWRLNWGHVPEKCTSTSVDGVGTLVCPNMQPNDSGAYSCEAINNKATTFAAPDAIVYVNKTVCPAGYFNSEARSPSECIRCFCFGESTQCQSADLFTYNMPTPLGEGGTRLVGVKQTPNGDVQLDETNSIADQYYYLPLRNGATVTKLETYASSWSWSTTHPYLTLPETYNGNQLTSYGGHIKYTIMPHSLRPGPSDNMPTVIIKGKYGQLVHNSNNLDSKDISVEARLTPEYWQKPTASGLIPASREDIMMTLDNIEMILLRADLNNAGVNISDFTMESAQHINVGLGAASLVEECTCPPGYEGLSCQKCASGFVREKSGPWLGRCVRPTCPAGTFGDPASGFECKPCPCPLTNRENQFSRTCSLGPDGSVICDCFPGYEGRTCEYCAPGYIGNPLVSGDSCRPAPPDNYCNQVGTSQVRLPDDCVCKDNVQGRYCDQCKNDSFHLSNDFRQGCALCFCSGVSQQCMSSNLRRKTTTVQFNVPTIVDQLKVYKSELSGPGSSVRYTAPEEAEYRPFINRGRISLVDYDQSEPSVFYWSLPSSFSGDKVTSYGGYLRYVLDNVPQGYGSRNNAPDVQLVSDNNLKFNYFGEFPPSNDGTLNATVQFLEGGWRRLDGKEVTREYFLMALSDVKTILIKASYAPNTPLATPSMASIETAESSGSGVSALHVEQCVCPQGYVGTSCEDCAPGFSRTLSGLYLYHCGPCECNGHSNMCHPETGVCYDCSDNTYGDQCEVCKPGFERDEYRNCVPEYATTSTYGPSCQRCDSRGEATPCDASGQCRCKLNVEGESCDRCRPGTFDLDANNPEGCIACYCSGVTNECHQGSHFARIPLAAPILGDNYGGYALMDLNAEQVISDQFVPVPDKSELMYIFPYPPNTELFWSLPVFPGNRVLSYGGALSLRQEFRSNGGSVVSEPGTDVVLVGDEASLYWINPNPLRAGESMSYQVPLRENGWFILNTGAPASRNAFMGVLKNLRRVLVRATVAQDMLSTSIADVAMDTAAESYDSSLPSAPSVEICMCPSGYTGTSCESCAFGYYKDRTYCVPCPCNGSDCQLDVTGQVQCNCRPPYTGPDCSTIAGEPSVTPSPNRPPPPTSTVTVRITSPTIRIQEVGSSVNFTCEAQSRISSNPPPIIWSKVDGFLPRGRSQIDRGILFITNLQITDSGKYVCQTNDGVTTAQATATLKVPGNEMTMPTVSINPAVNDYFEGDRIELECVVRGNPTPTITWQRSSRRPLPASAESFDELFIIESAREEDSGEYRCIASNPLGSVDRTAIVNIRPRPAWPPRDKLTIQPSAPSVAEGQSTRVVCTGTPDVPAGSIEWIRQDGAEFLSNVRSGNGVLYINNAKIENQGVYVCQSSSVDISPVPILVSVVSVGTPSPSDTPNITVSIDHLNIPTGQSGTIECTPQGYPRPLIRWSKLDGTFGPGTSQRDNTLIISNAQDNDYGYYVCDGNDDTGSLVAKIYVYVEIEKREAPRVEIWPQGEQAVALGSQYQLDCRVLGGVPDPDVTWARAGGRPISSDAHIQPHNILRFDRVEVNDEGEYTCSATNVVGSVSASSILKVHSPPEITILPNAYLTPVRGDSVNVECRASGYPEPTVSIKSSVDHREIVPPSAGIAVLRISSVGERDEGDYTCTATSPAGTMEEQFRIQVDRGDGGFSYEGSGDSDVGVGTYPTNPDERPSNLLGYEGQPEITIYCNASNDFIPTWDRGNRQPLQRNAVQRDSRLIIFNASKSDSGQYVCSLVDKYTGEITKAAYTTLVIIRAPRIILRPATQTVAPGESPVVECVVEGDEILDISWKPVDRPLSRRVETRYSTLIFHQIQVEDAGHYECFARNQLNNASAIAEVIVSEESSRTTSESHENEQFAHMGAAVHLTCNVSQPNVRIHWTKDGRPIPRSLRQKNDGSLYIRLAQKSDSGLYRCHIRDQYGRQTSNYINLHIQENRESVPALVSIEQPRRQFRVGENVDVLCRVRSREVNAKWEKYGTTEYVDYRTYGDGAMLQIQGIEEPDAGVYRCIGTDPYGRTTYEDFNLEVLPGLNAVAYPENNRDVPVAEYTAGLKSSVDLPCKHNLEQPVYIEWKREYTPLPSELSVNQPILHLDSITEKDAGTYTCRVSNSRTTEEARAILRVTGVVPQFDGESWLSLPTIKDAYRQLDIEVSFRPTDINGLILYNSQNQGRSGDFLALQLVDGVPQFELDTGTGPVVVRGDRPLQLNVWHTIRVSRTDTKVTMNVDNTGTFTVESPEPWAILDLNQPLYVGGVPDTNQLPTQLAGASGFVGCVSMLILGRKEQNIIVDSLEKYQVRECNSCVSNECRNGAVCQEARNERGYMCLCAAGFAGQNCDRTGEACRADLCGPGNCLDTADGYKCACPVTHYGKNCEVKQFIEYPAYTGSAYSAIKPPPATRFLKMSMKVKAMTPVTDGLIMYCAESPRGYGGFTSLAVHDGRLEFRYDLGEGSTPVVLVSNISLEANVWSDVEIGRSAGRVSLRINRVHSYEQTLDSPNRALSLETLMFVGGVDDSIILNNNTGVTGGFSGCVRDVTLNGAPVNIVTSSIQSVNVRDCSLYAGIRGDIPEPPDTCSLCRNGGSCAADAEVCVCPAGFTGTYCEYRAPLQARRPDACAARPCRNGGTCRPDASSRMNHTCDCPLGFAGASCQMRLELLQSVGFNGNGYLELPAQLLRYDQLDREPAVIALAVRTTSDGVLLYQGEALASPGFGDYILLRVERGHVVLDWDLGSGISTLSMENVYINDGDRHQIIATLSEDNQMSLTVDSNTKYGVTTGISNVMNADSNVYIGGIPDRINVLRYPGLSGCIEQVELMDANRGLNLGQLAVTGRNTQRCRESNRV